MEDIESKLNDICKRTQELFDTRKEIVDKICDLKNYINDLKETISLNLLLKLDKYNKKEDGTNKYLVLYGLAQNDGNYPDIHDRILGIYDTYKDAKSKIHCYVSIDDEIQYSNKKYENSELLEEYEVDKGCHMIFYAIYKIKIPS
jgi:hypothetical protein